MPRKVTKMNKYQFNTGEPVPLSLFKTAIKEKNESMLSALKCDLEAQKDMLEEDVGSSEDMLAEIEEASE